MNYAVIAAGEGSRLVGEGIDIPKPLIPLNGEPMIDRQLRIFLDNGAESVTVIINEQMGEVRSHLESLRLPVPFHLIVKSTPSSMHSFYELSSFLNEGKFCLTTVDTMFREDEFSRYISAFAEDGNSDGLMGVTSFVDDESPLYVSVDPDNRVTGFFDDKQPDCFFVSGGIYGLTSAAIPVLHRALEAGKARMRNFQRQLIGDGLVIKAFAFSKIIDVDHAGDIVKAEEFVRNCKL